MSSLSPYNRKGNHHSEIKIDSRDKDELISQLKAHIFEIEQNEKNFSKLNNKFTMLQNEFNLLSEEKLRLEYDLQQRSSISHKQLNDLRNDLESLQVSFTEKMTQNKKLYSDYTNMQGILESKNLEINRLRNQMESGESKSRELIYHQKQLEDSNKTILKMTTAMKELENKNERIHAEMNSINQNNQRELRARKEIEKEFDNLEKICKEKEKEARKYLSELEGVTVQKEKIYEDNSKMYSELEKLKNHIYILTEQNQKLTDELDKIGEQDEKIKNHLSRREKINTLVKSNRNNLEASLVNMEENLNNSKRTKSPNYYNQKNRSYEY